MIERLYNVIITLVLRDDFYSCFLKEFQCYLFCIRSHCSHSREDSVNSIFSCSGEIKYGIFYTIIRCKSHNINLLHGCIFENFIERFSTPFFYSWKCAIRMLYCLVSLDNYIIYHCGVKFWIEFCSFRSFLTVIWPHDCSSSQCLEVCYQFLFGESGFTRKSLRPIPREYFWKSNPCTRIIRSNYCNRLFSYKI